MAHLARVVTVARKLALQGTILQRRANDDQDHVERPHGHSPPGGEGQWHGQLKAGNANIAFFADHIGPDAGMVYVMLHEWLHQAESVMASNLGYFGLPGLHDLAENGYGQTDLGLPSATCWYRDFMFRLFRPAMWQQADMNRKTWWRPAPRSEYIKQWLVRGPFPNENKGGLDVDFLDGEADAVPVAVAETTFPIEDNAAWHVLDTAAQRDPLPDDATNTQRQKRADLEQIVDFTGDVLCTGYDLEAGLLGIEADDLERWYCSQQFVDWTIEAGFFVGRIYDDCIRTNCDDLIHRITATCVNHAEIEFFTTQL